MWTGPPAHQGPVLLHVYCDGVGELWKGPERAKGRAGSGPVCRLDRKPGGRAGSGGRGLGGGGADARVAVGSRAEGRRGERRGPGGNCRAQGVRDGGGEKNTPGSIMMDPPPGQDTLRGRPGQGKLLNSAWEQPVFVGHPTVEETKLRRSGSQSRIWEP